MPMGFLYTRRWRIVEKTVNECCWALLIYRNCFRKFKLLPPCVFQSAMMGLRSLWTHETVYEFLVGIVKPRWVLLDELGSVETQMVKEIIIDELELLSTWVVECHCKRALKAKHASIYSPLFSCDRDAYETAYDVQ